MATGCVKIVKKSSEFDSAGKFIPKEKRSESVDLFKGNNYIWTILTRSTNESCQSMLSKYFVFVFTKLMNVPAVFVWQNIVRTKGHITN